MFSHSSGRPCRSFAGPQTLHCICSFLLVLILCLLLTACGQSTSTTPPTATPTIAYDFYGRPLTFPTTAPQRIISLSPSMSEILSALHLDDHVVGVDYYTTFPASFAHKTKISSADGTYNAEQIVELKSDLILSDGGLTKTTDSKLTALGLHVVDLPNTSLAQVLQKIVLVGRLTLTEHTAQALVNSLQQQITSIKNTVVGTAAPKILLEVDDSTPGKPYVFGGGSFGDELIQDANGSNIFHDNSSGGGYPQVSDEAIIAANPQYIVLTEDPAYGGQPAQVYKRPDWGDIAALKLRQVYALNVNIMQHPSQRLVDGLRCLAQILHPTKFSGALPTYCTGTI